MGALQQAVRMSAPDNISSSSSRNQLQHLHRQTLWEALASQAALAPQSAANSTQFSFHASTAAFYILKACLIRMHADRACGAAPPFTLAVAADIEGCTGINCLQVDTNSNGTCFDVTAPGTGYTCGCKAGREWKNGQCAGVLASCLWC
jgi:hypothetical protein